jgi:hypothetical protein
MSIRTNKATKRIGLAILHEAHIGFSNPKFKFVRLFELLV